MSVRVFPMPKWPVEGRAECWCRWCGGEIVHGRKRDRGWHDGREDEPNCKLQWQLHTDRRFQFPHIEERDGLRCWDCEEAPEKWLRGNEAWPYTAGGTRKAFMYGQPDVEIGGPFQWVKRATALELEHEIPLWLISHLSDEERRPYFGPKNLRLRCPDCHKVKTRKEAGDRGKTNRLTNGPKETRQKLRGGGKLPGKGQGPRMKGRGFSEAHRPLRSRNDLKRR